MCGERFVLVDPGIAFAPDEDDITRMGCRPPGSLGYMSPEQCEYFRRRVDLDGRSDIFALGLTVVFALTRQHAYWMCPDARRSPSGMQQAINAGRWRPEYAQGVPQELVPLACRMLGYRPHERFASVVELQERAQGLLLEVSGTNG